MTDNEGARRSRPLPAIGFGTYPLDDEAARRAVAGALDLGYRLIDSATNYRNEAGVGRGIADSDVPRAEIVVTTKLPGRDHGYESTLDSFHASRRRLGLDQVDLYLIHWPLPRVDRYVDSWRAMIELQRQGYVRDIGVSNFTPEHIDRLERETGVLPSVNQVEMHPWFPQRRLREYHAAKSITTESWSPLGRSPGLLDRAEITAIARAHDVTPAQVVLRWHVQLGAVPIPKSADPDRQRSNLDVFGFELTADEVETLSALETGRIGGDPDTHEEF